MGLDISAYRRLHPAPEAEVSDDGFPVDWQNHWKAQTVDWTEQNWPGRSAGVDNGVVYAFAERLDFRAGSYSGYNWWRDHLARFAGHESAKAAWASEDKFGPFAELIDFADNEGVIGSLVAAKLARDFVEHQERAEAFSRSLQEDGEWWLSQYARWRRAFEMAADGGAVNFH